MTQQFLPGVVPHEIWRITPQRSYPIRLTLSVEHAGLYRHDVVSMSRERLERTVERLRLISPEDLFYEIRPKPEPDYVLRDLR